MFKKSLALVLCFLVLFSVTAPAFASSAGADDITKSYLEFRTMNVNPVINTVLAAASSIEISGPDPVSGVITVQGSFANAAQGSGFTYVIFYPGKTPADADAAVAASEPLDGIIADAGQGDVLADGGFAFDFALPPTASKGSYTIYVACAGEMLQASYEVYQIITSLTLNTPANLAQTYGSTEAVTFTATASPDGAVNPDTIEWYVNDVLQDETGTTFSYMPTDARNYTVAAKVSNNPDAMVDSKIIRVAKADVAVAWPEIQINYKSNLKLCDITLPTGFSWAQSDTKLNVSGGFYPAVYTPADTVNYSSIYGEIKIRVRSEGSSGGGGGGGGFTSYPQPITVIVGNNYTVTGTSCYDRVVVDLLGPDDEPAIVSTTAVITDAAPDFNYSAALYTSGLASGSYKIRISATDQGDTVQIDEYALIIAKKFGDYTYIDNGNTVTIAKYIGIGGSVTIPGIINGKPVISIEYAAFQCTEITSVVIPNSIMDIKMGTFFNCAKLTSVIIPNSVTNISTTAFFGCKSLSTVIIPESVTGIADLAFGDCDNLKSVYIPNSVVSIEIRAFDNSNGNPIIYCNADSYAKTYAEINSNKYLIMPAWPKPEAVTYSPSLKLSDIPLNEGFAWSAPVVGLCAPGGRYTMVYTPSDTNYSPIAREVAVTVNKATQKTPAIKTSKTSTAITVREVTGAEYGIKLKNSTESIVYSSNNKFTSLKSDTVYTVYIRMAAKENYEASPVASLDVRTETATSSSGNHKSGTITVAPAPEPTPQADPSPKLVPTDIAQVDWAQGYIQDVIDRGIMTGYMEADGTASFRPTATATRAEFATVLFNYMGFEKDGDLIFSDTKDHWAKDYIAKLAKEGIMTGISTADFAPDQPITREQLAAILYRALKPQAATAAFRYSDSSSISDWAVEGVYAVREAGWITGDVSGTFRPSDTATRAEIATIFSRLASKK